jgi:DNA mismatch repair protein PMS2
VPYSQVHRIQSGQVIVDICSTVKELVENSLDAGSTAIDVRFRNQGLDSIEIQDNGPGINPDDYESIALKHHTSKLQSYNDIASLGTYGFRGEALSSLCALAHISLISCRENEQPKGTKLELDRSGKLIRTAVVAARRGTIVSVEKLFQDLPVRRRELERNIKREWHKVVILLHQYACIQTHVKFLVIQQPSSGKRVVVLSTAGNHTIKENAMNIYGAGIVSQLLTIDMDLATEGPESEKRQRRDMIQPLAQYRRRNRACGLVSRPSHGDRRQSSDRQMFFVNRRPCSLPQFAKVLNDTYRQYNPDATPFIILDLQLEPQTYDVNVSPDKRTILLHNQDRLLSSFRESLIVLFDSHGFAIQATGAPLPANSDTSSRTSKTPKQHPDRATTIAGGDSRLWGRARVDPDLISEDVVPVAGRLVLNSDDATVSERHEPNASQRDRAISSFLPSKSNEYEAASARYSLRHHTTIDLGVLEHTSFLDPDIQSATAASPSNIDVISALEVHESLLGRSEHTAAIGLYNDQVSPSTSYLGSDTGTQPAMLPYYNIDEAPKPHGNNPSKQLMSPTRPVSNTEIRTTHGAASVPHIHTLRGRDLIGSHVVHELQTGNHNSLDRYTAFDTITPDMRSNLNRSSGTDTIDDRSGNTDTKHLQQLSKLPFARTSNRSKHRCLHISQTIFTGEKNIAMRFHSWRETAENRENRQVAGATPDAIDRQKEDTQAVPKQAPSLILSKIDFLRMRIIGQFNLGFILVVKFAPRYSFDHCMYRGEELFIIDQHASDEKYNFERLQDGLKIQSQRLVKGIKIDLTSLEETIVLSNMDAIETNGFKIESLDGKTPRLGNDLTEGGPITQYQVCALPLSKDLVFTVEDLQELLHLLGEHQSMGGSVPRPSKVRKMLATRACRSSIMIGKALAHGQMATVVRHMGQLHQPWHCPHGRPTMRHVTSCQQLDGLSWKETP